ncbi:MAG: hypothetical protein LIR46_14550 [Bacteroidota bacterium]|nr:hypothetical protein [Bacteroidota bacterium]
MEKLKLISLRIDPQTLQKVDAIRAKHYYWKRNAIINGLLTAVVDAMDDGTLYDMVRYSRLLHHKPKGSFYLPENLPINPAADSLSE